MARPHSHSSAPAPALVATSCPVGPLLSQAGVRYLPGAAASHTHARPPDLGASRPRAFDAFSYGSSQALRRASYLRVPQARSKLSIPGREGSPADHRRRSRSGTVVRYWTPSFVAPCVAFPGSDFSGYASPLCITARVQRELRRNRKPVGPCLIARIAECRLTRRNHAPRPILSILIRGPE